MISITSLFLQILEDKKMSWGAPVVHWIVCTIKGSVLTAGSDRSNHKEKEKEKKRWVQTEAEPDREGQNWGPRMSRVGCIAWERGEYKHWQLYNRRWCNEPPEWKTTAERGRALRQNASVLTLIRATNKKCFWGYPLKKGQYDYSCLTSESQMFLFTS